MLKNAKEPDIAQAFVASLTAPEASRSGPSSGLLRGRRRIDGGRYAREAALASLGGI